MCSFEAFDHTLASPLVITLSTICIVPIHFVRPPHEGGDGEAQTYCISLSHVLK